MTPEPADTLMAVERLKAEINKLTAEQSEALRAATYAGMTPDEAKEFDQRRNVILRLAGDLAMLQEFQ